MTIHCENCNQDVEYGDGWCECGAPLIQQQQPTQTPPQTTIHCENCGQDVEYGDGWCECGAPLIQQQQPSQTPPKTPQQTQNTGEITFQNSTLKIIKENEVTIGRVDFSNILNDDEKSRQISREHFKIFNKNNNYYIIDGNGFKSSGNGTKLNGNDIRNLGEKQLNNGDIINVADIIEVVFTTG